MNNLLLFFALPIATIILSIVLQKILRNAFFTAATFFAIYLIVTFAVFDINFLVFAIAYTILAYITAVLAEIIFRRRDENEQENNESECNCQNNRIVENITGNLSAENMNNDRRNYRCYRR